MDSRKRFQPLFLLIGVLPSLGATYQTKNYHVEAPTAELAQKIGREAERLRKDQAVSWLGKELPAWSEPCSIKVKITIGPCNGWRPGAAWPVCPLAWYRDRPLKTRCT